MIEDPKLAQMFRDESGERLARLDDGLLRLEKAPADPELLEELFRETHSLKGAARMLGLPAVESTAHALESLLNAARRNEAPLDADGIDALDAGLKTLRARIGDALLPAAAGPEPPPVGAAPPGPAPSPVPAPALAPEPAPAPPPPASTLPPAAGEPFRIETVRVETARLDDLLTLAGELGVLVGRGLHAQALMGQLVEQCALLRRSRRQLRSALPEAGASLARLLEADEAAIARLGGLLQAAHDGLREDGARFQSIHASLQERVHGVRLLPLATVFDLFPRMVRDLAREEGREVELAVEGADITLDKRILEEIKDPLMHLLRNAVGHGIEPPEERRRLGKPPGGRIRLAAVRNGSHVVIVVEDDGRGLDLEAIRAAAARRGLFAPEALAAMPAAQLQQLIFTPGFSTVSYVTELAGRGVGLDVVRTRVEALKGGIELDSAPGGGTRIALRLPFRLTTLRLLLVRAGGRSFGLPLDGVHSLCHLPAAAPYRLEGRQTVDLDGQPLLAPRLAEVLELPAAAPAAAGAGRVALVVLQLDSRRLGLQVEAVLSEEEVVPRPLGPPLKRVRNVASLAVLASGEICPVLNPADLLRSAARLAARPAAAAPAPAAAHRCGILLVEDSALVRAMEKRILEDAGYEVVAAVDGADALDKLAGRGFDAVVSDIQMPNLDGLGLTARIREDARYRDLPVVLVTALASDADKRRGLEVGANAYIPKPSFDQRMLLDTLRRLIGP